MEPTRNKDLVEIWFTIEKDADGFPESKSREGLLAFRRGDNYTIESVPFYLKNVSRGDLVSATGEESFEFDRVIERGGHFTYRLLLRQFRPDDPVHTIDELEKMGLAVEEEHGTLLAVDVPPSVDQEGIDSYLVREADLGRWEMQDGFRGDNLEGGEAAS
jgi:hypothetical protein